MLIYEPTVCCENLPQVKGISPRLAELLYARGAKTEEEMQRFLHPSEDDFCDPMLLPDMDKAVERIQKAIEHGEKVCVFGDYDADGVCAAAILTHALKSLGCDVFYEIPSRHEEGYGLSLNAVERLSRAGVQLIITVDNGVKAYGEIDRCTELDIDVVVTDHHRCDGRIPHCCAVVCHTRDESVYPNGDLCGAGIAYKLVEALMGQDAAKEYLPLAGIATMADVVPLLGENRAIVSLALDMINAGKCNRGVKALGRAVSEKRQHFSARDLSFGFAPRLNAAGRMDDAKICVQLLCTDDEKEADDIAVKLNEFNNRRKAEENGIIEDAAAQIEADDLTEKRCIVLKSEEWNLGVVGIAAARIAERYYRPTLLFHQNGDTITGSARSVEDVDIYAALNANSRFFQRFGGHAYAAGVTMATEDFEEFVNALNDTLQSNVSEELFIPRCSYEAELSFSELTMEFAKELELLAPFGEGNPEPVFRTNGVLLRGTKRTGSDATHIKTTAIKDDRYIDMVAFGRGYMFDELVNMERCDVLYTPVINEWQGMRSVQLRTEELRPCAISDGESFISRRSDKFIDAFSCNVLYNKGCDVDWKSASKEDIRRLLQQSVAGTLVLCFTPDGAAEMIDFARENGLSRRVDTAFFENAASPCAYNTLLFAPMLDKLDISRFRHVVLFDSCDEGIVEKIKTLAPDANILVGESKGFGCFAELVMDRSDFAFYYRAFASTERRFGSREELADYLASVAKKPLRLAKLSSAILIELGFAEENKGITFVKNPTQRNLMESPTFAALQRLKEE